MPPIGKHELGAILVLATIVALVVVLPFWNICKQAGLPPWLSLIGIVPFGALVLPFILAFVDWPALRRKKSMPPPL